jgi:hypothetical protein
MLQRWPESREGTEIEGRPFFKFISSLIKRLKRGCPFEEKLQFYFWFEGMGGGEGVVPRPLRPRLQTAKKIEGTLIRPPSNGELRAQRLQTANKIEVKNPAKKGVAPGSPISL